MKDGRLVYRCRRCGAEIKKIDVPQLQPAIAMILYDLEDAWKKKKWGAEMPDKVEFHHCEDGNIGITDLIGGEFD